jgi:RNA polymerase sigma-70 factor (ECF subfamily)
MVAFKNPSVSVPSPRALDRAAETARAREAAQHDAGLVDRFNAGDEAAFTEIVSRHHAKMLQVAQRLLRNHADAEEVAQDTFVRAHRGLARFRGDSSLSAWLYRIALNLARNRYWYFFRRRQHASLSLNAEFSDTNRSSFADLIASESPSPLSEAVTSEFSVAVSDCMAQLNPSQRDILILRNVQQHSYRHIAGVLGISVGTVKSRVARARENLRVLLAPIYANPDGPRTLPALSWFESGRPSSQILRAG